MLGYRGSIHTPLRWIHYVQCAWPRASRIWWVCCQFEHPSQVLHRSPCRQFDCVRGVCPVLCAGSPLGRGSPAPSPAIAHLGVHAPMATSRVLTNLHPHRALHEAVNELLASSIAHTAFVCPLGLCSAPRPHSRLCP